GRPACPRPALQARAPALARTRQARARHPPRGGPGLRLLVAGASGGADPRALWCRVLAYGRLAVDAASGLQPAKARAARARAPRAGVRSPEARRAAGL